MNKNRKCAALIKKSVATATMASMLVGSVSSVALAGSVEDTTVEILTKSEPRGALAGVMAATAQIHETILGKNIDNPVPEAELSDLENPAVWTDKLMANVVSYLNVRSAPSKKSEIVGRMRPTDIATIVDMEDDWFQIESGEVSGYVSAQFALVGDEVFKTVRQICKTYALCTATKLNIRKNSDTESEIIGTLLKNDIVEVLEEGIRDASADKDDEDTKNWVKVVCGESFGYVREDYVKIETGVLGSAMTPEDIAEAERLAVEERKAQLAASAASGKTNLTPEIAYNDAVLASTDEETLLAALLMCEAGASYEGMLAVGGVVMNRLRAGFAPTITDVIFQKGQFVPAGSGKLQAKITGGITDAARQAAKDAISGIDITGGCLSFRAAHTGHAGVNIGGNVFF